MATTRAACATKPCDFGVDRRLVLAGKHELILRTPDLEQHDEADYRRDRGHDVDELRPDEVRDEELHAREANAADDRRRQHAFEPFEAAHHQIR